MLHAPSIHKKALKRPFLLVHCLLVHANFLMFPKCTERPDSNVIFVCLLCYFISLAPNECSLNGISSIPKGYVGQFKFSLGLSLCRMITLDLMLAPMTYKVINLNESVLIAMCMLSIDQTKSLKTTNDHSILL